MWSRVRSVLLDIRTSLLLVPLFFAFGGLVLVFVTVWLDQAGFAGGLIDMLPGKGVDEDGARGVFSTIASGMMTVTSIVISLTFVALTMMSSQLGPRLLVFFMRDRTTKVVLGTFLATIIYSLVSMASVGAQGEGTFAPHLSFVVAILMAITSLGAMIYFVNHIAQSIQADAVVAQLARACDDAIGQVIRDKEAEDDATDREIGEFGDRFEGADPHRWQATRHGYLSSVDYDAVVTLAKDNDAIIILYFRVNTFIFDGQVLAVFLCDDAKVYAMREALENAIAVSPRRTPAQQLNFEMSALSEVALRALSPGINDPYTASACIDYLGNTLSRIALAAPKLRLLRDEQGDFRLLRPDNGLPFFLDQCIAPIIETAGGSPIALASLIRTLNRLSVVAHRQIDVDAVERQRQALREMTAEKTRHSAERERLLAMIDSDPDGVPPA